MFKTLGLFVCGISVSLQGLALYDDPWVIEDFERSARETGRWGRLLLMLLDITIAYEAMFALLIVLAGFFIMNKSNYAKL